MRIRYLAALVCTTLNATTINAQNFEPKDLKLTFDAKEVEAACKDAVDRFNKKLNEIGAIAAPAATFDNVVVGFDAALTQLNLVTDRVSFMKYVSTDEAARKAGGECEKQVSQLMIDVFSREDIYKLMVAVKEKSRTLDPVDARLLEEFLDSFTANGLALKPEVRKKYLALRKEIADLQNEFSNNLIEDKRTVKVKAEELKGLPADFISSLGKPVNDQYELSMSYPVVFGVLDNSPNSELRRKVQYEFLRRGGDKNVKLLEQAIRLRAEAAKLLGFKNHADFAISRKMAGSSAKVFDFLASVKKRLQTKAKEEMEVLIELKQKEGNYKQRPTLNAWDTRYYDNLLKREKYSVDHEELRNYFPLPTVLDGMFGIYQNLLGVRFVDVTKEVKLWYPEVRAYQVIDEASKKPVAYFFMDLHPREGKYTHAAAFGLANGHLMKNYVYHHPQAAIVANFTAPLKDKPSLLSHDEVETLFHEFGHIMHTVLTEAKYASLAGYNVKWDFVEAPSQMLESWVWEKVPLQKMSGHYQTKKPLPDALIAKLQASRMVNKGIFYSRQLAQSEIDMHYHTHEKVDTTKVYADIMGSTGLIPIQQGTIPQASFGHLMGGYDAGYYGYMWAEVFAADMASRFRKDGWMNAKTGREYRKYILAAGNTEDPYALLRKFLGREADSKAFFAMLEGK